MTRDEFAEKIHWSVIIWVIGFINVTAMLPQLYQIIKTHNVQGLSISMFTIYLVVQVCMALEGYFKRIRMLQACLGLSACISASIIVLILCYR